MSSYKIHTVFAIILSCLYFFNPFYFVLTIIGANIPDFDHKVKRINVYKMFIIGLLIFITLHILNLQYYLGIIIVLMAVIFYFSNHRGFTHSLIGIILISSLLCLIMLSTYLLGISLNIFANSYQKISILVIIISLLVILIVNKKLVLPLILFFLIGLFIFPILVIKWDLIFFSIFLGILSHIIVDSFTPAGVELLRPFSSKKIRKKFGYFTMILLVFLAIPHIIEIFKLILRSLL
jgi:inner membrane protein